jgi:hypothetical protein
MEVANTLAYYDMATMISLKSFKVLQWIAQLNCFLIVIYTVSL